jgi:hypothetical protein
MIVGVLKRQMFTTENLVSSDSAISLRLRGHIKWFVQRNSFDIFRSEVHINFPPSVGNMILASTQSHTYDGQTVRPDHNYEEYIYRQLSSDTWTVSWAYLMRRKIGDERFRS